MTDSELKGQRFDALMKSARQQDKIGYVFDPVKKSLNVARRWKIVLLQDATIDEFIVLIRFRTRDGAWGTTLFPLENISETSRLQKDLEGKNARLVGSKDEKVVFLKKLIAAVPTHPVVITSRTGFVNGGTGFVMPCRMYGSAAAGLFWDPRNAENGIGQIKGALEGYRPVLDAALVSPILTGGLLLALAAPLNSYVRARTGRSPVAEGAVFHYAGETSTGKSLTLQVIGSVFGGPDLRRSFDITERSIAECAAQSNDLPLIIDDSEIADDPAECLKTMGLIGRLLPRGYSKSISKNPGKAFPPLTWSCFGVTSGPLTSTELATTLRRQRFGQKVRFFDIRVPRPNNGGIFGSKIKAKLGKLVDRRELLSSISATISNNHGVLFAAWIDHLVENDRSLRIEKLINRFVQRINASPGAEERSARKFGMLYAAGVLGVSSGLLPWPRNWPWRAVAHLYRGSRRISDPDNVLLEKASGKLRKQLMDPRFFSRLRSGIATRFPEGAIGLRTADGKVFVCKTRLGALGLHEDRLKQAFINRLISLSPRLVSSRKSVQLRVVCGDAERKLRFWEIGRVEDLRPKK